MIPSVLAQQSRQGIADFVATTFALLTPFFHFIVDTVPSPYLNQ